MRGAHSGRRVSIGRQCDAAYSRRGKLGAKALYATGLFGLSALFLRAWTLGLGIAAMAAMGAKATLALAGFMALVKLSRVAFAFLRHGRQGLASVRQTFW